MDGPVNERDSIPTHSPLPFFLSFFLSSFRSFVIVATIYCPTTAIRSPAVACTYIHAEERGANARQECFTTQVPHCRRRFWKRISVCAARSARGTDCGILLPRPLLTSRSTIGSDRYRTLQDAAALPEDVVQTEVCSAVYLHHRLVFKPRLQAPPPPPPPPIPRSFKISLDIVYFRLQVV